MTEDFVRELEPFDNLKDPTNTIYDHLPYVKDITLPGIDKIQVDSGNVVKFYAQENAEPYVIDTNNKQIELIEANAARDEAMISEKVARTPDAELDTGSAVDEASGEAVASEEIKPEAPAAEQTNSFANVNEDDDDFSFLND
ncbi:MAG: hypothetical protein SPL99_00115 [Catonella sp.]|nr:hypothetical protein [Catonella sp.]MDY6357385.1 hypothetical protein [Catonella sp.]